MLVVGEGPLFLYHLPLFHPPHDYQVILEAVLSKPGEDIQAAYVKDRSESGARLYTFVPEPFVLPRLAGGEGGQPQIHSFSGQLVRGHFERGGTPIAVDVVATVRRVVHFRKFTSGTKIGSLDYLVFGSGGPVFVAHFLSGPPDFDQVASATIQGLAPGAVGSGEALRLTVPGRLNAADGRLQPGESAQVGIIPAEGASTSPAPRLGLVEEIYFEKGELAS
jgi:hypothetical protein